MPLDGLGWDMPENQTGGDPYQADRGRGMLSKRDRKYLAGETDHEGQSERTVRMQIRDRVRNGLLDMDLALQELDEKDLDQIFIEEPIDLSILELIIEYQKLMRKASEMEAQAAERREMLKEHREE